MTRKLFYIDYALMGLEHFVFHCKSQNHEGSTVCYFKGLSLEREREA